MKKLVIILYLTLISTHTDAAPNWQALWHTPDQQAQALLKQGKAQEAANTFVNPRYKAYAQLQAGEYAQAEKGFSQFKDTDAYYNRGNAYAHMNQLPQALQAYEQALKLDPHNKDAVHNRDLVKQALQKQQKSNQQKQSQQDQNQSGKNQQGESKDKSQANKQPGQNQENQQANSMANKDGNKSQQANSGQNANQKNQQGVTKPEQDKQAKAGQEQAQAKDSKEQAESDAKAAMAAQQAPSSNANQQPQSAASEKNESKKSSSGASANSVSAESMAKNEQNMAQKQWLKQIPDDPSGLLRRKLLIEHLIRQGADAQ